MTTDEDPRRSEVATSEDSSQYDDAWFGQWSFSESNVMGFATLATWLGFEDAVKAPPAPKDLPRLRKDLSQENLEFLNEKFKNHEEEHHSMPSDGWTAAQPYEAAISHAAWLTTPEENETIASRLESWGGSRRVVHLEIDLGDSDIKYSPGDSLGVCVPNPARLVESVASCIKEIRDNKEVTLESMVNSKKAPGIKSILDILTYHVDLVSTPRKAAVYSLSQVCLDEAESNQMAWLCSKCQVGKALWTRLVEKQRLGLGELLLLFPSCAPTLALLMSAGGIPPPRYYSISSAPVSQQGKRASVAFSIVQYTCSLEKASVTGEQPPLIKRAGLATSYMERLCIPWLYTTSSAGQLSGAASSAVRSDARLRIFYKPTINFRLPGSVGPPLILVGPGTGVAPFIGFLEQRRHLEAERSNMSKGDDDATMGLWRGAFELSEEDLPVELDNVEEYIASVPPGPVYLFFGCRNDRDYLFRDTLDGYVEDKTLSVLEVAMSRVQAEKVYVTHKIRKRGREVTDMLLRQGGYLYVCGDGNHMAKDVHLALRESLVQHSDLSEVDVDSFLQDLKARRRYVLDIWS